VFQLDTQVPMKVPPAEFEPKSKPQGPVRFTYPSGARPLEGYTIKRGVGRGGFGEVYFAVSDAGKEVALKLIRRNLDVELRGVKQCLNLKHQNLVALYDIRGDEHDDRWVVMEYVSGESLDQVIDRYPEGMPVDLALHWFSGIASGVAYLHDHGIVHRDLKPANIFKDESVVKIGDYGLSKFISCSRRSGQTESVGTVHYMAPEIANGRYGKEIDTYALGIILYEMLTGHVPFQGESVGEVLMKHLTAEPDLGAVDQPYRGIIERAMAKDPDLRLNSVGEMLRKIPSLPSAPVYESVVPPDSPASVEEPIAAAVGSGLRRLFVAADSVHPLAQAVGGFLLLGVAMLVFRLWFVPAMALGFVYLVYRVVRALVLPLANQSAILPARAKPGATVASTEVPSPPDVELMALGETRLRQSHPRRRPHSWQRELQQHVVAKPIRVRLTELLGSMILAPVVAGLLAILGSAIVGHEMEMGLYVWMTIVATLGSWFVMIAAKLTEGRFEDQAPLRFGMLVAGGLVGIVAWGVADVLLLEFPVTKNYGPIPADTIAGEMLPAGAGPTLSQQFREGVIQLTPTLATAYFAFLFVVLRWWRQADYTRPARVSIWSVLVCAVTALMMSFLWWFPQPLGAILAAMVAFTTQLSSPWMPPSTRRQLAEQGV